MSHMNEHLLDNWSDSRRSRHDTCIRCMAGISLAGGYAEGNKLVRDSELNPDYGQKDAFEISEIINNHPDDSIVIVGSPGIGKSTIAQHLDVVDMDSMFDTMPVELKEYLLHHEYYFDYDQNKICKRTTPFRQDDAYLADLATTTRQLSLYAEEFFREQLFQTATLIGTTPVHADKAVLLRAKDKDLLKNAERRSRTTNREVDFRRTLYIGRLIEKITREMFVESDIIIYNMQYE